jgi:hypothetical protein
VVLPYQHPARTRAVTRVRSTLLAASIQTIREMGWEPRYLEALPKERHAELKMLAAGVWVPLELAETHYHACDAMHLSKEEVERAGASVGERTQKSFVGTLGRFAAGAGATPWIVIANVHRIYARMIDGGDHCAYRLGPKDALIVNVGCPLVDIPYFRMSSVGSYRATAAVVSQVVYAHEVPKYRRPRTLGVRVSWV